MLVKFKIIISDIEEKYEKLRQQDMQLSVDLCNQRDKIGDVCIDIDNVVDFFQSYTYFNDVLVDCIDIRLKGNIHIYDVIVHINDFIKLIEKVNNVQIKSIKDILNE